MREEADQLASVMAAGLVSDVNWTTMSVSSRSAPSTLPRTTIQLSTQEVVTAAN